MWVRGVIALLWALTASSCTSCKRAGAANKVETPIGEAAQACDNQAAHNDDKDREAKGVADEDIIPAPAVRWCFAAVNEFPKVARFHFQLGRALLAGDRIDEAQKAFEKAAGLNYCPAKYYLGELVRTQALNEGSEEKGTIAGNLFLEAKNCGFGPAVTRAEELMFRDEGYGNPKIMESLWDGQIDELNDARLLVALYCRGIHDYIAMEFHPTSQDCPGKLAQPEIAYNLDKAAAGDPRTDHPWERPLYDVLLDIAGSFGKWLDPVWQGDREKYRKYFISLGIRDANIMITKNGCLGTVTKRIYGTVVGFARANRPLVDYKDTLLPKSQELFGDQLNPGPVAAPGR
jgi:hypothetical protein